jgi:4a-hydroxytetrahydrobiopterin dehydratase
MHTAGQVHVFGGPNEGMIDIGPTAQAVKLEPEAPQGWKKETWWLLGETHGSLVREIHFNDFLGAWAFASQVALLAEKRKHHPDMTVGYNSVSLVLTTHTAGMKLTPADYKLAQDINDLVNR